MAQPLTIGRESDPATRLRRRHGGNIRGLREMRGWSLAFLAQLMTDRGCPVSRAAIGMWERGETSPRWHHQSALAGIFQVPHQQVFPMDEVA